MSLDKLMLRFEALGDNCEFGLVQRQAGAEPLGLLRFAGFHIPVEARLQRLVTALDVRFEGLGDPATVRVEAAGPEGGREYLIMETAYDLRTHTFQSEGRIDPEALRLQAARRLQFLRRKLLADLEGGEKTLVWKSNLPLAEEAVREAVEMLGRFGPNTLLWVEPADADHPVGSVEPRGAGLIKAYIEWLAPYDRATEICYEGWFEICTSVHRLVRGASLVEAAS